MHWRAMTLLLLVQSALWMAASFHSGECGSSLAQHQSQRHAQHTPHILTANNVYLQHKQHPAWRLI